jgi:hypothetical protein
MNCSYYVCIVLSVVSRACFLAMLWNVFVCMSSCVQLILWILGFRYAVTQCRYVWCGTQCDLHVIG